MEFYKYFLTSISPSGGSVPGLHLTIFGKHPGWDDHIPDVGTTTETLSILKRTLYVRGIGGLIDAGAWDNLQPDDLLEDFNHSFVAQKGSEGIMGLMWASKDGKGRARYPMVIAVHMENLEFGKCLPLVMSILEGFKEDCLKSLEAEEILQHVSSVQNELNQVASELGPCDEVFLPSSPVLKRLLESEELRDSEHHERLLYEISQKMEPFSPSSVAKKGLLDESLGGEHIRLPLGTTGNQADAYVSWLSYLRTQVSPNVPVLLLKPLMGNWMDAIVGQFDGLQLLCLRSTLNHTPCVTDVKYNIPEEFSTKVEPQLTSLGDWEQFPHEKSVFSQKAKLSRRVVEAGSRGVAKTVVADKLGWLSQKRLVFLFLVIALVALIVAVFLMGGDKEPESALEVGAAKAPAQDVVSGEFSPTLSGAFNYLYKAEEVWYPRLLRITRNASVKEAWSTDPQLARLISLFESEDFNELVTAVGKVSNISEADLDLLDSNQRASLMRLARTVNEIERRLLQSPLSRNGVNVRTFAVNQGWSELVQKIDTLSPPVVFDKNLGDQIMVKLKSAESFAKVADLLATYQDQVQRITSLGISSLAEVPEVARQSLGSVNNLQGLMQSFDVLNANLDKLLQFLGKASALDQSLLMADSRFSEVPASPSDRLAILIDLHEDYQLLGEGDLPEMNLNRILSKEDLQAQLNTVKKLDSEFITKVYLSRWTLLNSKFEEASKIPRVRLNSDMIRSDVLAATGLVEELRNDVGKALADRADPAGWYEALGSLFYGTDLIGEAWRHRVEKSIQESDVPALAQDSQSFIRKRQEMDQWRAIFEEAVNTLDSMKFTDLPADASASRKKRYSWLQDVYALSAANSLSNFLEGLEVSDVKTFDGKQALENWKSDFDGKATRPFRRDEEDLASAEADLNGDGVGSYVDLLERITKTFGTKEALSPEIAVICDGIKELTAVGNAAFVSDLSDLINKSDWRGVRRSAWRRLKTLGDWPRTVDDLEYANALGQQMLTQGMDEAQLKEELLSFWKASMLAQEVRKNRVPLWQFHNAAGWRDVDLSEPWQYDWLICQLISSPVLKLGREEAIDRRDKFLKEVRSLSSISKSENCAQFLMELEQLQFEESRRIDQEQLEVSGPANVGWKLGHVENEGQTVIYHWDSQNLENDEGVAGYLLVFILVEPLDQERFYISTDEIPVGLFFDWISESTGWGKLDKKFPSIVFGSNEGGQDLQWRKGPRAWTLLKNKELVVPRNWQLMFNTDAVPSLPDSGNIPNRFSPMTYLSPEVAAIWATSINCRLPQVTEFNEASGWSKTELTNPNLRDESWGKHLQYILETMPSQSDSWPDQESFLPAGMKVSTGKQASVAVDENDGVVWFLDHTQDPSSDLLRNLRGNVSEYVTDPLENKFHVVGASALSPKEVIWDNPYPVEADSTGYSDVGFRLVFDAPTPRPGKILVDSISEAPSIPLSK